MPRKRVRRFTPRYGVSRITIEEEAKELHREMEDYLISSTTELNKTLSKLRTAWTEADATVEHLVGRLPERERLAILCLLVRDAYQLSELYREHLNSLATAIPAPISAIPPDDEERVTPFSEWLFPA